MMECEGPENEVFSTRVPPGHPSEGPSTGRGPRAGQEFRKYGSRHVCVPQHENGCAKPGKFLSYVQTFLILETFSCIRKHINIQTCMLHNYEEHILINSPKQKYITN